MIEDDEPFCYTCVSSAYWNECESCGGDGSIEDKDDIDGWGAWGPVSEPCNTCGGTGGWWDCLGNERHNLDPGSIHRVPLTERPVIVK